VGKDAGVALVAVIRKERELAGHSPVLTNAVTLVDAVDTFIAERTDSQDASAVRATGVGSLADLQRSAGSFICTKLRVKTFSHIGTYTNMREPSHAPIITKPCENGRSQLVTVGFVFVC